jgi:hypothetical protein
MMAELQREADASMADPSTADTPADDAGGQKRPAPYAAKRTRQLALPPDQAPDAPEEEPGQGPADADSETQTQRPLSLFRRRR